MSEPPPAYHNGNTKAPDRDSSGRRKPLPANQRIVIAWDMEGINISGDDKPQHPVLFGCSAQPGSPLVSKDIPTLDMLNYICDIGQQYPQAIHVGYHFKYDANMILQDLDENLIRVLWRKNRVRFKVGEWCWTIQYFPGKKFIITRSDKFKGSKNSKYRTTVTIYDYSSFFGGQAFLTACENILGNDLTADDRKVIEHGKAARQDNAWSDMASIRYYWSREIILIERVFRRFRDVMHQAGFALREWYGPGALANYINSAHGLKPHIRGAQKPAGIMPCEVHTASKIAFSGGRFEAFQIGRIRGPVYAIDINSAYPYALTHIPSLAEGEWVYEREPATIAKFGFYHIEYSAPESQPVEYRPMPLFWRNRKGLISYPNRIQGWYASPETSIVAKMPGVRIVEGWHWRTTNTEFPWRFLNDMYDTRQRLGKENLLSIPFKLGPNSLYGKYAQTVGWNEKDRTPPTWHALPIAAWITSMCRAMLWNVIQQAPDKVVAVETDSVFLTEDPRNLDIHLGDKLGEWSLETFDEVVYIQSGMYLKKKDGEWKGVRSRGISRHEFKPESVLDYLRGLQPGEQWDPYSFTTSPRFVGMGAALATTDFAGQWRTWQSQQKDITFGDRGKRRHHQRFCRACEQGLTPLEAPHRTFVFSESDGDTMSHPRALPWETKYSDEIQEIRDKLVLERELVS